MSVFPLYTSGVADLFLRFLHSMTIPLSPCVWQNVEAKGLREPSLEAPRRGTEVKDDDPIIPFGPQPTVSRFGAISRTSKTGYQTTGPVQAMASTPQNPNSKHMAMPGKNKTMCTTRLNNILLRLTNKVTLTFKLI